MKPCPRCGSSERESGELLVRGSPNQSIRFRPDSASVFSFKKEVRALACLGCGHVELLLDVNRGQEVSHYRGQN